MNSIILIAGITVRDILRRYIIYIALFVALISIIGTISSINRINMMRNAGEEQGRVLKMQRSSIQSVFGIWNFFGIVLAVYLGSTVISNETKTRTILAVLSRPIARWQFLAGKCLGVQVFFLFFMFMGIVGGLALAMYYAITPSPIFWLALINIFVGVFLLSGVSIGLSSFMSSVLSGGTALLLIYMIPRLAGNYIDSPEIFVRSIATAVWYLAPAHMPVNLVQMSLTRDMIDPQIGLYIRILLENVLYSIIVMGLGAAIFSRRDVPLK